MYKYIVAFILAFCSPVLAQPFTGAPPANSPIYYVGTCGSPTGLTSGGFAYGTIDITSGKICTQDNSPIPTGGNSIGLIGIDVSKGMSAPTSIPIDISTATTTQLIALNGSTKTFITSFNLIVSGTGTARFVYGTGTNCATGTTNLTGAYPLTAQAGLVVGDGGAAILIAPPGKAVCITTSAAIQYSGSLVYQQF